MSLCNMPLFELFLPIIQNNTIQNWTAGDFWKHMKLSKKERNRFNRQRIYRILRKLVEFGFLEKQVIQSNPKFSRFNETDKIGELRERGKSKADISKMRLEEAQTKLEISFLEAQAEKYFQLEKNFPSLSHQISDEKSKCLSKIIELKAYRSALKSVIDAI